MVADPEPQSNQRGIETARREDLRADVALGLNRTSVGLKPRICFNLSGRIRGLNRTSVGLKPLSAERAVRSLTWPQSNQRGIETIERGARGPLADLASIEPAWD